MAKMDWGMDEEGTRLQRRLAGTGGGAGAGGGGAAAQPRASAGVRVGQNIRRGLGQVGGAVAAASESATRPTRRGLGVVGRFVTDVRNEVARPDAVPPPLNPSGPQNGRPINRRPRAGAGGVAGTPSSTVATAGTSGQTTDLGTFSGDQGYRTRGFLEPEAGADPAAGQVYRGLQRDPQDLAQRTISQQGGVGRRARAQVMGGLPRDEIIRRLEHSQSSYFNKGRPSARAAIAGVYADQLAAADGTSARQQEGGNRAALSGMRGVIEGELAQQGAANAGVLEGQRQEGDRQLATLGSELSANAPETMIDERGNVVVRRGLGASQVTGTDGQPLRAPAAPPEGQITPAMRLQAVQDEILMLSESGRPKESDLQSAYDERMAQLRAELDQFMGRAPPRRQVPVGTVEGGYRFKGGDPGSRDSWEKL